MSETREREYLKLYKKRLTFVNEENKKNKILSFESSIIKKTKINEYFYSSIHHRKEEKEEKKQMQSMRKKEKQNKTTRNI